MLKSAATRAMLGLAVGCGGVVFLSGCDNGQRAADSAAADAMSKAEQQRQAAKSTEELQTVQASYSKLAGDTSLSPAMQSMVKGGQAQVHMQLIAPQLEQLTAQSAVIEQKIAELSDLGMRLSDIEASITAMKSEDPSAQIAKLNARAAELKGTDAKSTWNSAPDGAAAQPSPALTNLQSDIDRLNAAIAKTKSDHDAAVKTRTDTADQAETTARTAEGEAGDQQTQDLIKAANLRRDAAVADAQAQTLAAELVTLQYDLDADQARLAVVQSTLDGIAAQVKSLQTTWDSTQAQIAEQQNVAKKLVGTSGVAITPGADLTIAQVGDQLTALLQQVDPLRKSAGTDLDGLISEFQSAATQARSARNTLLSTQRDASATLQPVWAQIVEAMNPFYLEEGHAAALQARALLDAQEARINVLLAKLLNGYTAAPQPILASEMAAENPMPMMGGPATQPGSAAPAKPGGIVGALSNLFGKLTGGGAPAPQPAAMPMMPAGMPATEPSTQPAMDFVQLPPVTITGLLEILSPDRTGTDMPKSIADLAKSTTDMKKAREAVDARFKDAVDAFTTSTSSTSADNGVEKQDRSDSAFTGLMATNQEWAAFDSLFSDADADVKQHQADAMSANSQISWVQVATAEKATRDAAAKAAADKEAADKAAAAAAEAAAAAAAATQPSAPLLPPPPSNAAAGTPAAPAPAAVTPTPAPRAAAPAARGPRGRGPRRGPPPPDNNDDNPDNN